MGQNNSITIASAAILTSSAHASVGQSIDDLLEKITAPKPGEEFYMYGAIAFACLVVYLIYSQVTSKKHMSADEADQLTLSDVIGKDANGGIPSSALDPEDKLLKSLDENLAKFEINSGLTSLEGAFNLRCHLNRSAQVEHRSKKEELMQQRIEALKKNDMQGYANLIGEAQKGFADLMQTRTKAALDHLGLQEEAFVQNCQKMMKDPAFKKRVQANDIGLAREFDPMEGSPNESKEEIKKIIMEKARMDIELQFKLAGVQMQNQQQRMMVQTVETTRVHDMIYMKYKIRAHYLSQAVEHYDLVNDPEIKTMQESLKKEMEQRMADAKKKQELTEDQKAKVMELAEQCGSIQLDMSLQLGIADFIKVQGVLTKVAHSFKSNGEKEHIAKRRELLKNQDVQGYQKEMSERQVELRMKIQTATKLILNHFNIPEQTWPMSQQKFMSQAHTKQQVEQELSAMMQELQMADFDMTKEPISKEEALKCISIVEQKKIQAITALSQQVRAGKLQQQQMMMIIEMEKEKHIDEIFLQFGVDGADIQRAVMLHDLTKTPEFAQIMRQVQMMQQQMQQQMMQPPQM